jgi:mRNA interferase HigB
MRTLTPGQSFHYYPLGNSHPPEPQEKCTLLVVNDLTSLLKNTSTRKTRWRIGKRLASKNDFSNFAHLREVFPSADKVGKLTVFNIGGNRIRLVAAIHYNRRKIYVRAVLRHAEYDEGQWKE